MAVAVSVKTVPYKEIKNCRVCGSVELQEVWNGGEMHIVEFPRIGEKPKKPKVPVVLLFCLHCGLVQLRHTTDPALLYSEFWYRSGMNEMMREELKGIAQAASQESDLPPDGWVLDIGSNDGTLLKFYEGSGLHRVGCDPAKNLKEFWMEDHSGPTPWDWVCDYFSADRVTEVAGKNKFKAVTAIAMLYDLQDPVQFCRDVAKCLAGDGVFIAQMNYLPTMLESGAVDNISHEHLTYFTLGTLLTVFRMAGLEIYKAETNPTNGGSVRVYACHKGKRKISLPLLGGEQMMLGQTWMGTFRKKIERMCEILDTWLAGLHRDERRVYAYGASTRGTCLLQLLSEAKTLRACAERDPRKFGRYMVGSNIPIMSEEDARKGAEYFFVCPWHFSTAIEKREADWMDSGGRLIVPLPEPRILERNPWERP